MHTPFGVVEEVLLHKRIHAANNAIQREQFRREWFVVMRRSLARKQALHPPPGSAERQPDPLTSVASR